MFLLTGKVKPEYFCLVQDYFDHRSWDVHHHALQEWNMYTYKKEVCDVYPSNVYSATITSDGDFKFQGEVTATFPLVTMKVLIWDKLCEDATDLTTI